MLCFVMEPDLAAQKAGLSLHTPGEMALRL